MLLRSKQSMSGLSSLLWRTPVGTHRSAEPVSLPAEVEGLLLDVVADGFMLYCCGDRRAPTALAASYEFEH